MPPLTDWQRAAGGVPRAVQALKHEVPWAKVQFMTLDLEDFRCAPPPPGPHPLYSHRPPPPPCPLPHRPPPPPRWQRC